MPDITDRPKLTLRATVLGMRKHACQQLSRDCDSRYGLGSNGRRVADVSAEELPIPAREEPTFEEPQVRRKKRRFVLGLIFEFTQHPQYRSLLWRRLFRGAELKTLAESLGIPPATARSVVMRGRRYLGLKSEPRSSGASPD